MTALPVLAEPAQLPSTIQAELSAAVDLARNEKSQATRRAYRTDFGQFLEWCGRRGVIALPASPETVCAYLAHLVEIGCKASTISRRIAAIGYAHKLAGHNSPARAEIVNATVRGIRRTIGTAVHRKTPVTAERVRAMSAAMPDRLIGLRDRALLLLGFAGAFRRSELVALNVSDVQETADGLRVRICRSKTDQEAQGTTIAIVHGSVACPVRALKTWLSAASIDEGPLFRAVTKGGKVSSDRLSSRAVSTVVKRHAKALGLDPGAFGGHSLRAGFLTSAAARGASIFKMMDVSRHRSVNTLRGYVRDAELFRDHAGAGLL
jgi:site-specific recombinase XerD